MKLYYAPMTRSTRPRWLLEELEVPYELVRVDMTSGQHLTPEHRKVHPLGAVPAFEDDGGQVIFESAAICAHLADKFPEKGLAPAPGTPERGLYYQWLFFGMTELEPPLTAIYEQTIALPEGERSAKALETARADWKSALGVLEQALAGKEHLLGDRFSAADVVVGSILGWARAMKALEGFPDVEAYAKRVGSRPAAKKARAD